MPSGPATFLWTVPAREILYIQTDEQGRTFTLSQDMSAGLKTTLNATAMDGSNLTDSTDAIFTVITSPDSDKASMWGHMPETFVNSKGPSLIDHYCALSFLPRRIPRAFWKIVKLVYVE